MLKIVHIYTDGACRGNPGIGGWGAVLSCNGKQKQINGAMRETTNNRMELMAAIQALLLLKEPCQVELTTDSEYLQKGIGQWIHKWKQKNWQTRNKQAVKNKDLWLELDKLVQIHKVCWHWVRGHTGHPGNELADQLANEAIDTFLRKEKN